MSLNDTEAQRAILNRLRRASGQLGAVIAAVEAGASCREVVTQLSAVNSALERAGFAIISNAMKECLMDEDGPSDEKVADLEKLFMMIA